MPSVSNADFLEGIILALFSVAWHAPSVTGDEEWLCGLIALSAVAMEIHSAAGFLDPADGSAHASLELHVLEAGHPNSMSPRCRDTSPPFSKVPQPRQLSSLHCPEEGRGMRRINQLKSGVLGLFLTL